MPPTGSNELGQDHAIATDERFASDVLENLEEAYSRVNESWES